MIKIAVTVSFLFQTSYSGIQPSFDDDKNTREAETMVYLCNSNTAKKYHYTENCRGLEKCTHSIIQVSLADAKSKYGRSLCGWED